MLHPRDIPEMEARLAEIGVPVDTLCARAEIDRTTWWRWREAKVSPRLDVWERAVAIFEELAGDDRVSVAGGNLREAS